MFISFVFWKFRIERVLSGLLWSKDGSSLGDVGVENKLIGVIDGVIEWFIVEGMLLSLG